ncbi:MAG: hypothetical protein NZ927_06890 [Candidatus Calescibacterium sp.]|nr:hypothetical protein [Candidatus Calescibacterium sp.]MCX7734527.1 hypothetical protein [bacterium]MDW8087648.1 hypothetical protein [Candidatus Calescibacterium sp.]
MEFESILKEVSKISDDIFILARDGNFKESSEKLEKAMFKMLKLLYLHPNSNKEEIKNELKNISMKFNILRRYFELILQIETEANTILSKEIKSGSICNRKI